VRGWVVDLDTGVQEPMRDRIARLVAELEPYAERYGALDHLTDVRGLLVDNGSDRQRYVQEREGVDGLVRWLVDQTERSATGA
jgi:gamma-glutamyl:cysteine ligase YbdK (ATP-grasp superfamily)